MTNATAADAIIGAAKANLPNDVAVYDTIVPGIAAPRYVVLYIPDELRRDIGIIAQSDELTATFQATCTASNANPAYSAAMCRWLTRAVRDLYTDLQITADGMLPATIRHQGSQSPRPDEATPDKKVYSTAQFSYQTLRV
jgi:hypothetical protein